MRRTRVVIGAASVVAVGVLAGCARSDSPATAAGTGSEPAAATSTHPSDAIVDLGAGDLGVGDDAPAGSTDARIECQKMGRFLLLPIVLHKADPAAQPDIFTELVSLAVDLGTGTPELADDLVLLVQNDKKVSVERLDLTADERTAHLRAGQHVVATYKAACKR